MIFTIKDKENQPDDSDRISGRKLDTCYSLENNLTDMKLRLEYEYGSELEIKETHLEGSHCMIIKIPWQVAYV